MDENKTQIYLEHSKMTKFPGHLASGFPGGTLGKNVLHLVRQLGHLGEQANPVP